MGFWPFGGAKKTRTNKAEEKSGDIESARHPEGSMAVTEKTGLLGQEKGSRRSSRQQPLQQSRNASNLKASVAGSKSSAAQGRSFTAPVASTQTSQDAKASKEEVSGRRDASRPSKLRKHDDLYKHNPTSNASLGPENFSVAQIPTLNAKRSNYDSAVPRQQSSKRKAEEYAREREVKAMSSPIPIPKRPVTYSGGPLRRDTKKIPGDLNRHFSRPTSEVSLPLPESFSEMSDTSYHNSFKIGMLAALSPRPTVRYDSNPRSPSGKQRVQPKPSLRDIIHEEDPTSRRRIDDLADDLDSGGLRELLDRDRKRRERKREQDKAKLQRKLERRAERQKDYETRHARTADSAAETPAKAGPSQKTGLGVDSDLPSSPPTYATTESRADIATTSSPAQQEAVDSDPFADPVPQPVDRNTQRSPIRNPFEDEKDDESALDPFQQTQEFEPVLPVRSPLRKTGVSAKRSKALVGPQALSPPVSPVPQPADRSSISQASMLARDPTPDIPADPEPDRRASDQSQHLTSWTSFFRRGGRRTGGSSDRGRATPDFSNTSRESFSRRNPPPIIPPRSFRRTESGTPQRTMSKFREDLPELPLSPPDSRVQSPEAVAAPSSIIAGTSSRQASQSFSGTMDGKSLATSSSVPTLEKVRQEEASSRANAAELADPNANPATDTIPQSLASVDSEGSWLSGKPVKRISGQSTHLLRQSQSSLQPRAPGAFEQDDDEDVTNDEYFNQLSSAAEERRESSADARRKASSTVIDLQQEQERSSAPELPSLPDRADEKWHGSVGRQPQLVRQTSRAKSREGLLNEYQADEAQGGDASSGPDDDEASLHGIETSGEEYKESPLLRAKSVEYKGHARHISAGSARLLDIRRASVQSEGLAADKRASATNLPSVTQQEETDKSTNQS